MVILGVLTAACMTTAMFAPTTSDPSKGYRPASERRNEIFKEEKKANAPVGDPWERDDGGDMLWPGIDLAKAERGDIQLQVKKRFPDELEYYGGGQIDRSMLELDKISAGVPARAPEGSVSVRQWSLKAPAEWDIAQLRISPLETTYFISRKVDRAEGPQTFKKMVKDMRSRFGLNPSDYSLNSRLYGQSSPSEAASIEFENRKIGSRNIKSYPVSSRLQSINMFGGDAKDRYMISIFVNVHGPLTISRARDQSASQPSAVELLDIREDAT